MLDSTAERARWIFNPESYCMVVAVYMNPCLS